MKELIEGNAKWFKVKVGLCDHGLNIRKELIDSHASIAKSEAMFGKKKTTMGLNVTIVLNLVWLQEWKNYMLLFIRSQNSNITNNTIGVTFTRVIFIERKGKFKVN
jgi:hypothetical protein